MDDPGAASRFGSRFRRLGGRNKSKKRRPAVTRTVVIGNRRGLHARAAARFVKVAAGYDADVTVARNGNEVSGLSIMGLMTLAAGPGCEVELRAAGADAEAALDALERLIDNKFDEE